jgi:hypothetical protein
MGVPVLGAIRAWGTIETAVSGFRAEYAAPVVLAPYAEHGYTSDELEQLAAVSHRYDCLLVTQSELASAAEGYGKRLPETMYPNKQGALNAVENTSRQLHLRIPDALERSESTEL